MQQTLKFATLKHKGQRRKTGEEYINHPIFVMKKVQKLGLSEEFMKVALLHDVIEDCSVTREELEINFNYRISDMVFHLTKQPKNKFPNYLLRKSEYLENIQIGIKRYPKIAIIKICDQIDNLRFLHVFTPDKIKRKILEIKYDFIPIYEKNRKHFDKKTKLIFDEVYLELLEKVDLNYKFYVEDYYSIKTRIKLYLRIIIFKFKMTIFNKIVHK